MATLGWKLGEWKADYLLSLPRLSEEECELVEACAKRIASSAKAEEGDDACALNRH